MSYESETIKYEGDFIKFPMYLNCEDTYISEQFPILREYLETNHPDLLEQVSGILYEVKFDVVIDLSAQTVTATYDKLYV